MTSKQRRLFAGIIALAVLFGFLYLYGKAIYLTLGALTKPELPDAFIYVGTSLAGLIGAVIAMFFNEKLPDVPVAGAAVAPHRSAVQPPKATPSDSGPRAGATAVRSLVAVNRADYLGIISTVYCIGYFLAGFLAIIAWVKAGNSNTPDIVKNLALIFIGLALAIARSFFAVPEKAG